MKQIFAAAAACLLLLPARAQVERASFDTSPFALGSLTEREGALPRDLWAGSTADTVAEQLRYLPIEFADPVKRELLRRVLLSPGEGPSGADAALAGLKLTRAAEAGFAHEAGALAELTPGLTVQPALSRIVAMRDLYAGDIDRACGRGASLREGRQDPFFVRLRIFCYLHTGEGPAAELTLSLAREEGALSEEDERTFASLQAGEPVALPTGPLSYAAFRRLGGTLAPSDVPALHPGVAAAAALDKGVTVETREAALLRAGAESLLPPRELGEAAMTLEGSPLRASAASIEAMTDGSAARQAAIGEALAGAGANGRLFGLLTKAFAQEIASATPAPETAPYAVEFALASLVLRRFETAERWMQAVATEQSIGAERAFANLANLYGAVRPAAAQTLAGAIGERIVEADPPSYVAADPAAQRASPTDLAEAASRAVLAAGEGSRAGMLLAALELAGAKAGPEAAPTRDAVARTLMDKADAEMILGDIRFEEQALSFAGKLREDVVNAQPFVPRIKPAR